MPRSSGEVSGSSPRSGVEVRWSERLVENVASLLFAARRRTNVVGDASPRTVERRNESFAPKGRSSDRCKRSAKRFSRPQ